MNAFVVTVVCAVGFTCPFSKSTYKQEIKVTNQKECVQAVRDTITSFGQKPENFIINCEKK